MLYGDGDSCTNSFAVSQPRSLELKKKKNDDDVEPV